MTPPKTPRPCKDCAAEYAAGLHPKMPVRKLARKPDGTLEPGPRCITHHRTARKRASQRAHDRSIGNLYGISPDDYRAILDAQGGYCYGCRRANGRTRRLTVDHNHRTGAVRGLLCRPCNTFIGHLRDDPQAFIRMAQYLRDEPAQAVLLRKDT